MEIKKLFLKTAALILILAFGFPLAAQESFPQKIEWKSNANALEYRVEVQNLTTGKIQTITTDKNSTELSLSPDRYRYRVHAYDFLGKEASVSSWTNFEVFKAGKPKINGIEKTTRKGTDGSVGISVEISDVNENSKFELVNESLSGTISAEDRLNMKRTASETENISHLDFKNVPPGKWRLRVTNPSGLSSLSDVITVEGDKTYSADEIEKIKFEIEENVRAEMQEKFDSEVEKRLAEIKLSEEKRLADAKKAEEDRIAEEERLAELERQRLIEEEEEAKRAAEEEKRRLKEERKRLGYQWKDFIIEGGLGATVRLCDADFKNNYDESYSPALNIRAMFLPVKKPSSKMGVEFCYIGQKFSHETDFLKAELISNVFDAKIVWQKELVKTLHLQLKAGGGINYIKKNISYSSDYLSRTASGEQTYSYPVLAGNVSIFCNTLKFIVLEVGADYTHTLTNSAFYGMVTPYACAGIRF